MKHDHGSCPDPCCQPEPLMGIIVVSFDLVDAHQTRFDAYVKYSLDLGTTFKPCTPSWESRKLSGLRSSPKGIRHTFDWLSVEDLGHAIYRDVVLEVVVPRNGGVVLWIACIDNTRLDE